MNLSELCVLSFDPHKKLSPRKTKNKPHNTIYIKERQKKKKKKKKFTSIVSLNNVQRVGRFFKLVALLSILLDSKIISLTLKKVSKIFLVCSISWDSGQLFCPYQILLIEKKNRNNNNNSKGISLYTIKLQRG